MSTMRDAPILKAVADVIKAHVGKALGAALTRIDAVEGRLNDLPAWFRKDFVIPKGEKGDRGDDGRPGESGAPGVDGRDGASGANGLDGAKGLDGAPGQPGRDGTDGAPGKQGDKGIDGTNGKDGKDGLTIKGDPGENGRDGKDGIDGAIGQKGIDGKDGRDGIDGKDAPSVDTKALSEEIFGKVLSQIPAPVNGKDGRDGNDGESPNADDIVKAVLAQIPPPIPGKDGKDIDAEALSVRVASEVAKAISALPKPAAGRDGRDGRAGEQGEPGKDAADLDFLEGIDESASYQRGVFAHYRNGIWQAYRTTDPVIDKDYAAAGWRCLVPGMVDIVESLAPDRRTIIRSTELSDGQLITTKTKTMALLDQGVWKEGITYEQGDSVTVAGSLWIAQETTLDRPGISKAWRLAVKRGSDGKDLRPKDDEYTPNGKGSIYLGAKR